MLLARNFLRGAVMVITDNLDGVATALNLLPDI